MEIKPGTSVEISIDTPSAMTEVTPLKATIYDVMEKRLILSQTSPPIPSPAKRPVYISYILKKGNAAQRFGCPAMVSGYDYDYRLASGIRVPSLIVDIIHEPQEISIRRGFRVRPTSKSGISLVIGEKQYAIFDISIVGIRFIQRPSEPPLKLADKLECQLIIDGQSYQLEARVCRLLEIVPARHVGTVFVEVGRDLRSVLEKKILLLEREYLSRQI